MLFWKLNRNCALHLFSVFQRLHNKLFQQLCNHYRILCFECPARRLPDCAVQENWLKNVLLDHLTTLLSWIIGKRLPLISRIVYLTILLQGLLFSQVNNRAASGYTVIWTLKLFGLWQGTVFIIAPLAASHTLDMNALFWLHEAHITLCVKRDAIETQY